MTNWQSEYDELTPWRRFIARLPHRRTVRERDSLRSSYGAAVEWRRRNEERFPDDWRWAASLAFQHDRQVADQIDIELDRSEYVLVEFETAPALSALRRAA